MKTLTRRWRRAVELVSLVWNAKANAFTDANTKRVTSNLDRWLRQHPDVQRITLTEAKGVHGPLGAWARRNGWTLLQEQGAPNPSDERGDTAMLLKTRGPGAVKVLRSWVAVMTQHWTVVSHRQRKAPRRQWRAVIKVEGKRRRVASDHWPTDNPTNAKAHRESLLAAKQFLSRSKSLLDGDLNSDHDTVAQLADDLGGQVRGRQPDWVLTTRGRITDVRWLDNGGSDHDAFVHVVRF